MWPQRWIDTLVGLFILCALVALAVLAFRVSGLTHLLPGKTYHVNALFDEIGGLKAGALVKVGGVEVGQVQNVALEQNTFKAVVTMAINDHYNQIPDDSSAGILTAGLLGDNYIEITPMYSKTFLKEGSQIQYARSAMVLEKLIGQFMYQMGKGGSDHTQSTQSGGQ